MASVHRRTVIAWAIAAAAALSELTREGDAKKNRRKQKPHRGSHVGNHKQGHRDKQKNRQGHKPKGDHAHHGPNLAGAIITAEGNYIPKDAVEKTLEALFHFDAPMTERQIAEEIDHKVEQGAVKALKPPKEVAFVDPTFGVT